MAAEETTQDRMTDAEFHQLARLLARYADQELDQFEHWRVATQYGPVFIDISRQCPPGTEDAYDVLWPLPNGPGDPTRLP
ncbi:hypothetical protein BJ973_007412 [Actinoplanes tereljensis]|uniref:Uncharacterized protein n=1 Tax=Paractinoplanes tereljensis TaxID=571912 RepID=A0A919TVS8_9ACTN|nr:hypothetical protein [Actinoplanes tereljensis]GIF25158.1 hypothetical protein Ate02nite_78880 [Actinoplanes tereljensis]